jgi:hypothetical protein
MTATNGEVDDATELPFGTRRGTRVRRLAAGVRGDTRRARVTEAIQFVRCCRRFSGLRLAAGAIGIAIGAPLAQTPEDSESRDGLGCRRDAH